MGLRKESIIFILQVGALRLPRRGKKRGGSTRHDRHIAALQAVYTLRRNSHTHIHTDSQRLTQATEKQQTPGWETQLLVSVCLKKKNNNNKLTCA